MTLIIFYNPSTQGMRWEFGSVGAVCSVEKSSGPQNPLKYKPWFLFQNPSDLLKGGILVDPMMSSKQAQKLLRLICMQKDCGDVDVAGKFCKILIIKKLEKL